MADSDRMPKVDMKTEFAKLRPAEQDYIKKIERKNLERVAKLQRIRKRNIGTGIALGAGVIGIYFYSMYAVKQEKFLDFEKMPEEKS